jgi:hypothetical protein
MIIKPGSWRIEHQEDCNCSFNWHIDGDSIDDGCDGSECWEGNVLYVGDKIVAEYIRYEGLRMLDDRYSRDDLTEEIIDAMRLSGMGSGNPSIHEDNRRESLIGWIDDLVGQGYRLMRDNQRGFANQYVSILVSPDADPNDVDDDWEEQSIEEWARDYLYAGDASTEPYNSIKVI